MGQTYDSGARFVDVNLDGFTDIVRSYSFTSLYNLYYNYYVLPVGLPYGDIRELYINTGKTFVKKNSPDFGSNYTIKYLQDTTNYLSQSQILPIMSSTISENLNPKRTDILTAVTGTLGARTDITYKGTASDNLNPNLPINILVVDQIQQKETMNTLVAPTQYSFEGGRMYYNQEAIRDRRFAGFRKVTVQEGNKKTVSYFHQGDGDDPVTYER